MKITLKLYATMGDFLPAHARANTLQIEIPENATPNQVIERYEIPKKMAHLVLLNGVYVDSDDRDKAVIQNNDAMAVWPPVAGG